ncbi:MAG TPA: UDP-N-acetylmuramate dehydrogenase [Acidimicrobiales bacterium]|nr:UDP-N-acetylmuramate dehydrogenase [Acidimicrobiales bacterium]
MAPAPPDGARRSDLLALAAALGPMARVDVPLGRLTTYRVGGSAAVFCEPRDEGELEVVRRALAGRHLPVLVLGKGSNLLVADAGFPGLVVQLTGSFADIALPPPDDRPGERVVRAGGAVGLPVLARRTVEVGLLGLEWAVGVPGSVGGAVRMNAGGHGSDTAAALRRYRWLDLASEAGGEDDPHRLHLGYRTSDLKETEVVVWAELAVRSGRAEDGRAALAEIVRWRRQHQPGGSNAGSVFTNPPDDAAGRLVEVSGCKGLRVGTAAVSTKHANFIQADDGGSADDVRRLIDRVRREVAERTGVELRTEVRLVGFAGTENGAMGPADEDLEDG